MREIALVVPEQAMREIALVVPSIRKDSFTRFVAEWQPTGLFDKANLILVEDNPTRTFDVWPDFENYGYGLTHLSWEDIDGHEWSWIIPRRSDTVRSFGYWYAWMQGYKYIMTLDDDTYPEPGYEKLAEMHVSMLTRTKWFNTLNSVRPRGTPYKNLGKRDVMLNHGLWTNVLDYDAPQQLVDPVPEAFTHDNRIVPHGAFFSMCGMNVMWRREMTPLMYHLLMGKMRVIERHGSDLLYRGSGTDLRKLEFDWFGDIWCGILMKKVCDRFGWAVTSGTPYIHHDRASDVFTNLRKEACGIGVNETFWERIDAVDLSAACTVTAAYKKLARAIGEFGGEHSSYWEMSCEAMVTWADLFVKGEQRVV